MGELNIVVDMLKLHNVAPVVPLRANRVDRNEPDTYLSIAVYTVPNESMAGVLYTDTVPPSGDTVHRVVFCVHPM